jgi:hypothetical protein
MPICNTIAMNHHLREISSQVGTAAHALLVLKPAPAQAGGAGRGRRLARQPNRLCNKTATIYTRVTNSMLASIAVLIESLSV